MAKREVIFGASCFWRETMREPKFGPFDARLVVFLAIAVFWFRIWTVLLAFGAMFFFWTIARFRLPAPSAIRWARCWLAGPWRAAQPAAFIRGRVDYGFETRSFLAPRIMLKDWQAQEAQDKQVGDKQAGDKTVKPRRRFGAIFSMSRFSMFRLGRKPI